MKKIDFGNLNKKIRIVEEDIQTRFPNCGYTINIVLWNDGTDLIECRHGHKENDDTIISVSTFYDNKLTYVDIKNV